MTGARINGILRCLTSGETETGWIRFLDTYSPLIRRIIFEFEDDETRSSDCFEFVCAKLSDDAFRRLRAFKLDGPARFRTWLTAVVANLCIDWRRSEFGRFRPPGAIKDLPQIEQQVFQCVFRNGMTRPECMHVLQVQFPKISIQQISEVSARLHTLLTPKQRWRLSHTRDRPGTEENELELVVSGEDGPEAQVQSDHERRRLQKALTRLDTQQRLCLQLRYQQDLTLSEVARLMGLSDPFAARRKIESALSALGKAMKF